MTRYHGTGFGHVFIYHQNDCLNNRYVDQLTFMNMKNLKPYNCCINPDNTLVIDLPPRSVSLTLFRIENLDNCSHKIVFSSKVNNISKIFRITSRANYLGTI